MVSQLHPAKEQLSVSVMERTTDADDVRTVTSRTASRNSFARLKPFLGCCADDPRTYKGRQRQLCKVLSLAVIPIALLVIQCGVTMHSAITQQIYARFFRADVLFATEAGDLVHALALERGMTTFYTTYPNEGLLRSVHEIRKRVDYALSAVSRWPITSSYDNAILKSKDEVEFQLTVNRLSENDTTPEVQLRFYTLITRGLLTWIGDAIVKSNAYEQRWQLLTAYHLFISAKESFAAERGSATVFFAQGNMSLSIYLFHHEQRSQGQAYLNKSIQYNPEIGRRLFLHYHGSDLEGNLTLYRTLLDLNNLSQPAIEAGRVYFSQMSKYLNLLHDIEKKLARNITDNLDRAINHADIVFGAELLVLIVAVVLLPSITLFLRHITGQIQAFPALLQAKNEEIFKEKKRAEALLYQLLPRQIAMKLKNRESIQPESYEQVTVFLSDVVGFTGFAALSTPLQVVETLNKLYTVMDDRVQGYDVYKVETIGDAYLCVSGLPERNKNRHSYEIASLSLELVTHVALIQVPHKPDYTLRLRIGMHTGPCAAGIIGLQMPRYCIFGDTVNTASRMESLGEPLRIHLSSETNEALKAFKIFHTECRGDILVKGKGLMTTYWLVNKLAVMNGKKPHFTDSPTS